MKKGADIFLQIGFLFFRERESQKEKQKKTLIG